MIGVDKNLQVKIVFLFAAEDLGITRVVLVVVGFLFVLCPINSHHCATPNFFITLLFFIFYKCLPTYFHLLIYPYLPLSITSAIHHFIYIYVYPFKPTNLYLPTYIYLPTHVNLPSSTYLPLPIPKYHYIIAADQGAGIGFNL